MSSHKHFSKRGKKPINDWLQLTKCVCLVPLKLFLKKSTTKILP